MITTEQELIQSNEDILQEMQLVLGWKHSTYIQYYTALKDYTSFQRMNITDLLNEADTEEEIINKLSKRSIKTRLIKYRIHLQQQGKAANTIKQYMNRICKIYKYYDIEVPTLPPVKQDVYETFEDIPDKEIIKKCILHSRTKMKAIITFIASSGLRRSDVANITIKDFIDATEEYHNALNIIDCMQQLNERIKKQELIIPTWSIKSIKTGIKHITFNSPECTVYILQMLTEQLMKKGISNDDYLFGISSPTITINFHNLNDRLNLGWKKNRRYFHPHSLRKYFATTLNNNDVDYITTEFLVGHKLSGVNSSYYFADPNKLKNKYMRVMQHFNFTMELTYIDVTGNEKRELEYLRDYKQESEQRILQLEEMVNLIQNSIK